MLSEVNLAQKVKGHMFSLICGSLTYKWNVYIGTHTRTHIDINIDKDIDIDMYI
jgi:hypothetical protein